MIVLSAHISTLFAEHDYADRPRRALAAGFAAIETWWPEPADAEALVRAVTGARVPVALLNADGGDAGRGERGFLNDPDRADEALDAIGRALALARRLACPRVHVLVGRRTARSLSDQRAAVVGVLRAAAPAAQAAGITLVIEPLNALDEPGYLTPTVEAVAALIDAVDRPNVQMLFDAYHVARAGRDPVAALRGLGGYVAHAQFADCPGRGAPGTGTLDLWAFVAALDRINYRGAVGLEYRPRGRTGDELDWLEDGAPRGAR